MKINQATRTRFVCFWRKDLSYREDNSKTEAHRLAKLILHNFATETLGLEPNQFEIRSNMAGIAVSGEVTLHTDRVADLEYGIYIQISDSGCMGPGHEVLFRACDDRKDYTGKVNNFGDIGKLFGTPEEEDKFGETVRAIVEGRMGVRMPVH